MDLKKARILLTNDDGVNAHGINLLKKIITPLCPDVWVIAPESEQSAKSHALTIHRPLRKKQLSEKTYAVSGTPTDCVIMGVHHILADQKPTLILSGINHGINLAEDVHYSGTVAAAFEATMLGIPAIALSFESTHNQVEHWEMVEHYLPIIIHKLIKDGWPRGILINVNFPNTKTEDIKGIYITQQGQRDAGFSLVHTPDPRGFPYYWISGYEEPKTGAPNSDLIAIEENAISITPLSVDLTHQQTYLELKKRF